MVIDSATELLYDSLILASQIDRNVAAFIIRQLKCMLAKLAVESSQIVSSLFTTACAFTAQLATCHTACKQILVSLRSYNRLY